MLEVVRIPNEEIKARSEKMKSLINRGNQSAFDFQFKDSIRQTSIQAVPYCDNGCAHCMGSSTGKKSSVVYPSELRAYLKALKKTVKYKLDACFCVTGIYGDPFCGFNEENSVDYYVDITKALLEVPDIETCVFITSGAHLGNDEALKELFTKLREVEREKQKQFYNEHAEEKAENVFITFSIDKFHEKMVSHNAIRQAIKTIKDAYSGVPEDTIIEKLGFRGQTASSVDNLEGGKEYLDEFISSLGGVFDKEYGASRFHSTVNTTSSGRSKIVDYNHLGGNVFTKSRKDDALVITFIGRDKIYEYGLKVSEDGVVDSDHLLDIRMNMVLDSLSLVTAPLYVRTPGENYRSAILLDEFCNEESLPADIAPEIRNSPRLAFETLRK